MIITIFSIVACGTSFAAPQSEVYANSIWAPSYHGKRLSYCLSNTSVCGQPVADRYCRLLGYDDAELSTIDYNVGSTSYLDQEKCCRGWQCHGFELIRCTAKTLHKPRRDYYYRYKEFVLPRYNHYRVDWCYEKGKRCGKRAAYSFCRRMGYAKVTEYYPQEDIAATRHLGDRRLCFGDDCKGFSSITCYR